MKTACIQLISKLERALRSEEERLERAYEDLRRAFDWLASGLVARGALPLRPFQAFGVAHPDTFFAGLFWWPIACERAQTVLEGVQKAGIDLPRELLEDLRHAEENLRRIARGQDAISRELREAIAFYEEHCCADEIAA